MISSGYRTLSMSDWRTYSIALPLRRYTFAPNIYVRRAPTPALSTSPASVSCPSTVRRRWSLMSREPDNTSKPQRRSLLSLSKIADHRETWTCRCAHVPRPAVPQTPCRAHYEATAPTLHACWTSNIRQRRHSSKHLEYTVDAAPRTFGETGSLQRIHQAWIAATRLRSKQVMDVDTFHESTGISNG